MPIFLISLRFWSLCPVLHEFLMWHLMVRKLARRQVLRVNPSFKVDWSFGKLKLISLNVWDRCFCSLSFLKREFLSLLKCLWDICEYWGVQMPGSWLVQGSVGDVSWGFLSEVLVCVMVLELKVGILDWVCECVQMAWIFIFNYRYISIL